VKEDIMRKHLSNSQCQSLLRHLMSTAVLASAGWLAVVSPASAQGAADPELTQAPPASATADGALGGEALNVAAHDGTDTKPVAFQPASAMDASVTVADSTSTERAFVTDADVTRYDVAALDDRVLDHQRGRAVGMLMVAATPNGFRANSVTLWDEIGPPVQTPQPSDAARAQTGNIVTYNRK
jgi:hypothetical protein